MKPIFLICTQTESTPKFTHSFKISFLRNIVHLEVENTHFITLFSEVFFVQSYKM